jgi:hypothetical protein
VRRRTPDSDPDTEQAAEVAHGAAWWAERAQHDEPLTLDEFRRYDALTHQRDDVETAIRAVIDAPVAAPAVARSCSVHARAEYERAAMGSPGISRVRK